nr:RNA-directed DNA polymerase, eukaryota, reverse transcriptase zinc-binding domain protein [Tanacetum cinerariifolium]
MSGNEDHHRQDRRFVAGGNGHGGRDPRDVKIERLRQRVRDLEIQHEIRQIRKRIRELELQRELTKETESMIACTCHIFPSFLLHESRREMYWVQWKTILLDPKFRGLGVGCLMSKNPGLLGKWKWRFLAEEKVLWNIVIKEFYGADGGFNVQANQLGSGGIWSDMINAIKNIDNIDSSFKSSFVRKVSSGSNTLLWKDPWCRSRVRLIDFPRLFALKTHKDCNISERWSLMNNAWGWN